MPLRSLKRPFFARSVHEVAPELIGATLLIDDVGGRIVEVEAYHHTDPAAHSFRGMTERNAVMFGAPGYAYVYRSYGIHWCLHFEIYARDETPEITVGVRIGITKAAALPWRYGLAGSKFLSKPFRQD